MNVESTLKERGSKYGSFHELSLISQSIKHTLRQSPGWNRLSDAHREALEMMATKQARILSGDPLHIDNWHDIAGYAELGRMEAVNFKQPKFMAGNIPSAVPTAAAPTAYDVPNGPHAYWGNGATVPEKNEARAYDAGIRAKLNAIAKSMEGIG